VLWTDAAGAVGAANAKDDTSNATAVSLVSGTVKYLYGIAGSTGTVRVTVTSTANNETANTIAINPKNAAATYNTASDANVLNSASVYAATITTPSVTPSMTTTGAAIALAGKIADQYGNPLAGASVTVTGTPADN
jgi:hypothetical protein